MSKKPAGTGMLFQRDAKTAFTDLTRSRYGSMKDRLAKEKLPPLTFSLETFRDWTYNALGYNYDGAIRCRYCNGIFALEDCNLDHEKPLSRGGSESIDNLRWICKDDNLAKGPMTPNEYEEFLSFLDAKLPFVKDDILKRLRDAVSLVIGARRNAILIRDLKSSGAWDKAKDDRKQQKQQKLEEPF